MVTYENLSVDMSKVITGGNPDANVIGTVFQEVDQNKNVVFQWRSIDHLPITDTDANPMSASFDHVHGNAAELDTDGNYILSLAVSNEIIKVNRATGDVMWRFGGRQNQFTITGEHETNKPYYFSKQHDIQRLPNGNIFFYDNGISNKPSPSARAVEYKLDETNKTASLVWEWRHTPDLNSIAEGSAQRMPNGNTVIGWGVVRNTIERAVTEVTPAGKTVFEMHFPSGITCYRAYKHDLPLCSKAAEVYQIELKEVNTYSFDDAKNTTGVSMIVETIEGSNYNAVSVIRYDCPPVNISFEGKSPMLYTMRYEFIPNAIDNIKAEVHIKTNLLPKILEPEKAQVYYRDTIGKGKFNLIPVIYNSVSKELVFTVYKLGEFAIGIPFETKTPTTPILISPVNSSKPDAGKSVTFFWSLSGYAKQSHLQIASDSEFKNIVLDTLDLLSSKQTINNVFTKNSDYFWRVQSKSEDGTSLWSDVWKFTTADPFLTLINPNGGETLKKDSSKYIIRWDKNIDPLVRLDLYRNGSQVLLIKDSLNCPTGGFAWIVPVNTPTDSTYKIKVTSIRVPGLSSMSAGDFKIADGPSGVLDLTPNTVFDIFPNPVKDYINLKENGIEFPYQIQIISLDGGLLLESATKEQINVSHFTTGAYILKAGHKIFKFVKI